MYKVTHKPSGQEINILDVLWARQIEHLRSMDKKDALVCPACEQPVRVRAGKYKRHHFAHKHLENCPFQKESPELRQARAVLYRWLVEKIDAASVSIEKQVQGSELFRPIDCWVEAGEYKFAYWIFDRRLPPAERENLLSEFRELNIPVQWVFINLLNVDTYEPKTRLHLTTTERAFIQISNYDPAWQKHYKHLGGSLHYLDSENENLITYRDLRVIHEPQLYGGTRLETPLSDLMANTQTGELVHPGEIEKLERTKREIERQKMDAERRVQLGKKFFQGVSLKQIKNERANGIEDASFSFGKIGRCQVCGEQTPDWVTYFGDTQECICRDCKDRLSEV